MANKKVFYLKVRVEVDKDVTNEEVEEIVNELDYSVNSKTEGVNIVSTEIADSARTFGFEEEE